MSERKDRPEQIMPKSKVMRSHQQHLAAGIFSPKVKAKDTTSAVVRPFQAVFTTIVSIGVTVVVLVRVEIGLEFGEGIETMIATKACGGAEVVIAGHGVIDEVAVAVAVAAGAGAEAEAEAEV